MKVSIVREMQFQTDYNRRIIVSEFVSIPHK